MPVKFYLDARANKQNECPIRLSVSVKGARLLSTTGFSVKPEIWDERHMRVKPHQTNSKKLTSAQINRELAGIENALLEFETSCKTRPTNDQLIAVIKERKAVPDSEETKQITALECFDTFCKDQSLANQWTAGTLECWSAFRKHLSNNFGKATFDKFDDDGITGFIHYLRNVAKMEEKTVQKHYGNLRWFLNWAIRRGYASDSQIGKVQPKFKVLEKPVIFLTKEELLRLYNFEIPANGTKVTLIDMDGKEYEKTVHEAGALAKTRDLFCFCAFTSLRYSDMAKVKRTDIIGDCLYVTTQKTNDRLPIDLNSFAKAILKKYENETFPKGLALPVIANQNMNYYLKDLCELCGFNTPITKVFFRAGQKVEETYPKWALIGTHAGRRTFICFALASGIPPQVVMKWTGHSDYKAMRPYIDIAEKTKAAAMALFDMELKA